MKELSEYTEDELRSELKRRAYIRRVESKKKDMLRQRWSYWEGKVFNIQELKDGASVQRFRFFVKPKETKEISVEQVETMKFCLVFGKFKLSTMPRIGDSVRLRYYLHKSGVDYIDESKIIEVIKRKGE